MFTVIEAEESIFFTTFILSVVFEIGYVHTKVEQDGTHGGNERWPQVDQVLNS
jgi:hypothetical protein